jgi:peroxiredoxin family protein/TusA-related sulfurtransferase
MEDILMVDIKPDQTMDASGLSCPKPVLKTKKTMDKLEDGQILEVITTDKGSVHDIPAWADKTGNTFLELKEEGGEKFTFYLKKGGAAPESETAVEAPKKKGKQKMTIIASKGTLDMAYPPLILASTGASLGMDVSIFFTFFGLDIVNKHKVDKLKIAPVANPAMPMGALPFPKPLPKFMELIFSNFLGMLPGMTAFATWAMKKMFAAEGVATIPELVADCKEMGVKFIACQMTMDVMGCPNQDLIPEVDACGGAAAFLAEAADADITLFI